MRCSAPLDAEDYGVLGAPLATVVDLHDMITIKPELSAVLVPGPDRLVKRVAVWREDIEVGPRVARRDAHIEKLTFARVNKIANRVPATEFSAELRAGLATRETHPFFACRGLRFTARGRAAATPPAGLIDNKLRDPAAATIKAALKRFGSSTDPRRAVDGMGAVGALAFILGLDVGQARVQHLVRPGAAFLHHPRGRLRVGNAAERGDTRHHKTKSPDQISLHGTSLAPYYSKKDKPDHCGRPRL